MDNITIKLISLALLGFTHSISDKLKLRKTESLTRIGSIGVITYIGIELTIDLINFIKETF